jgi:hypothetical protein
MAELHFDFRDIFRAGRYGFTPKKITVHLFGLVLAYLIYEILVYASLFIAGGSAVKQFWDTYALLPVCPLVDYAFEDITISAMWLGTFILFVFFFLTSTMVSKITIEQLRGDHFFSMKASWSFVRKHWKSVFGTLVGLVVILVILALIPIFVGLLGKIPTVGRVILMFASVLTPFAFFIGLLMAYLLVGLGISLFFAPSVVAAVDSDAFETAYQHLTMVWNQPWRVFIYEGLLLGVKVICIPIWGIFCLIGFALAMQPIHFLIPTDMQHIMWRADRWLGGSIDKLAALPYMERFKIFNVFDLGTEPTDLPITLDIAALFMTLSLLFIAGLIVAYLFSIASAGNTVIYTILRRRIDGENLLEVEDEEDRSDPVATEAPVSQTDSNPDTTGTEEKVQ